MSHSPHTMLHGVNDRLNRHYGVPARDPLPLDNKPDPLDELVYLSITQRTHAPGSNAAYRQLKERFPDWSLVASSSINEVTRAVEMSGLADLKALRIKRIMDTLPQEFGSVTLDPLWKMDDDEALRFLTKRIRTGVKTAYAVMMYSLGRDVFPADAHCLRILRRLGLIPPALKHETANRRIHEVVPAGIRFDLHVNMVKHGRAVCTGRRPKCDACVLEDLCPRVGL